MAIYRTMCTRMVINSANKNRSGKSYSLGEMSTVHVNIVTLLSQMHYEKGRFSFSFDIIHKDHTSAVIEKRKAEKQVYVEHECTAGGGRSPEIELHLNNGKCKVRFTVSGALKHIAPLEKGEDVLEFNEAQGECRKIITFVPKYDESFGDTGFIKFKVGDEVKHTVYVHEVPTERDLNRSTYSNSSSYMNISGSSTRSSISSLNSLCQSSCVDKEEEYVNEVFTSTTGGGAVSQKLQAKPLDDAVGGLRIGDSSQRPPPAYTVQVEDETAFDKIVCDESLSALAAALQPSQANMLVRGLRVPGSIQAINQDNHPKDVVSAVFHSLKYWRTKKTSRQNLQGTGSQELYEDLTRKLEDMGRSDITMLIRAKLAAMKKLEHDDFKAM